MKKTIKKQNIKDKETQKINKKKSKTSSSSVAASTTTEVVEKQEKDVTLSFNDFKVYTPNNKELTNVLGLTHLVQMPKFILNLSNKKQNSNNAEKSTLLIKLYNIYDHNLGINPYHSLIKTIKYGFNSNIHIDILDNNTSNTTKIIVNNPVICGIDLGELSKKQDEETEREILVDIEFDQISINDEDF